LISGLLVRLTSQDGQRQFGVSSRSLWATSQNGKAVAARNRESQTSYCETNPICEPAGSSFPQFHPCAFMRASCRCARCSGSRRLLNGLHASGLVMCEVALWCFGLYPISDFLSRWDPSYELGPDWIGAFLLSGTAGYLVLSPAVRLRRKQPALVATQRKKASNSELRNHKLATTGES
jgi:hypothetical protein